MGGQLREPLPNGRQHRQTQSSERAGQVVDTSVALPLVRRTSGTFGCSRHFKTLAPAVPSSSPSPLHSPQHPRPSAKSGRSAPPTPSSTQNPTFRDHRSHSRRGPLSPVSKHWEKGRSEASNGRSSPFRDAGSKRRNPIYISGDCSPRRSAVSPLTHISASP